MAAQGLNVIFGGEGIGEGKDYGNEPLISELYKTLKSNGIEKIDTARLYGNSEEWMGKTRAGDQFVIDSKTPGGFVKGESNAAGILQHAKETVQRLGVDKVDIYYIHSPDSSLEIDDMLQGINDAYKAGYFNKFGLSNFKPSDVEYVYNTCKEKGYPVPAVFQGNYSAVARKAEVELLPLLRKLGISFYVYSPLAGGFLAKTKDQLQGRGENAGRFAPGHRMSKLYNGLYDKPSLHTALDLWEEAAQAAGCSRAELAYRWVAFDSPLDRKYGDSIIIGASRVSQAEQTLGYLKKGSVGAEAKAKIDKIWDVIKDDAPLDNFNG